MLQNEPQTGDAEVSKSNEKKVQADVSNEEVMKHFLQIREEIAESKDNQKKILLKLDKIRPPEPAQ